MASAFETLARAKGVLYGDCAGVWSMILFAQPTVEDMRAARPTLQVMKARYARGFPTLTWVLPEAGFRMDADAREEAGAVTREVADVLVAQSTVIEGSGFQVATVRAIVAGLDLLGRSRAVKKTFSDLSAAVVWTLARRVPGAELAPPTQVTLALQGARSTLPLT